MDQIYFQYPARNGPTYLIDVVAGHVFDDATDIVDIDGGLKLHLSIQDGWVSDITEVSSAWFDVVKAGKTDFPVRFWHASCVIPADGYVADFKDNWDELISQINAAAAVNTLFTVLLTDKEYKRLVSNGLDDIKAKLSPSAASRVALNETSAIAFDGDQPALDVYRVGRCR